MCVVFDVLSRMFERPWHGVQRLLPPKEGAGWGRDRERLKTKKIWYSLAYFPGFRKISNWFCTRPYFGSEKWRFLFFLSFLFFPRQLLLWNGEHQSFHQHDCWFDNNSYLQQYSFTAFSYLQQLVFCFIYHTLLPVHLPRTPQCFTYNVGTSRGKINQGKENIKFEKKSNDRLESGRKKLSSETTKLSQELMKTIKVF